MDFVDFLINRPIMKHPDKHYPLYDIIRQDLFGQLENILDFNVSDINSKSLCNLLLFGKPDLDVSVKKMIIEETLRFIENTKLL